MRKLSLILAFLLVAGMANAQSGISQNPGTGDILGQGKHQSDAHKIFRMVRYVPPTYNGSSTLAADSIVIWDLSADDGVTVTTTTTSTDSAVAGIIVTQALTPEVDANTAVQDRGKRNWTWLQTYGLSQVNVAPSVGPVSAAGNMMGTSATAGEAHQATASTSQTTTRANGFAGFFYDTATGGDDDVQVFLRGLD